MRNTWRFLCVGLLAAYAAFFGVLQTGLGEAGETAAQKETIIEDFDKGYWLYDNPAQELRIEVNRYEEPERRLLWYEADISTSPKTPLQFFPANPESPGRGFKYAERIARDNHLVFAINDDQFGHRLYNHETVGVVVRDGKVLSNKTKKSGNVSLPNLDVGAFFGDGSLRVFQSKEHTGEEYVAMGATNVLCFGPYILRDGEINPSFGKYYRYRESRCALGIVEPYHYKIIVVEGRTSRAQGVGLQWVAERMKELGVSQAINLDGGHTSSILFMGKKLESTNPKGLVLKSRSLSGMIGLGTSDSVPAYEGLDTK